MGNFLKECLATLLFFWPRNQILSQIILDPDYLFIYSTKMGKGRNDNDDYKAKSLSRAVDAPLTRGNYSGYRNTDVYRRPGAN